MQGSLDDPPIVVRAARWKSSLYLLIGVVFVSIGVLMLVTEHTTGMRLEALFVTVFFGLCVAVFTWQLVWPGELVLSPEGLRVRQLWRGARYAWSDVRDFRPYSPGGGASHVGFDFAPDYPKARRMRALASGLGGVEGGLGTGWEMSPGALCDLLNAARAKWL